MSVGTRDADKLVHIVVGANKCMGEGLYCRHNQHMLNICKIVYGLA